MILLNDFNTSVKKAFDEIDPNWEKYPGYVICGTHSPGKETTEEYIKIIENCRLTHTPFLGICYGFQLAVIEYARNLCGIKNAGTQELNDEYWVVQKLSETRVGLKEVIDPITLQTTKESHWHNYYVPERVISELWHTRYKGGKDYAEWGMQYKSTDGITEWYRINHYLYEFEDGKYPPKRKEVFFVGVQYHPEYQSSIDKPHPLLVKFLENAKMAM